MFSNDTRYGKRWAVKDSITDQDKDDFRTWVDSGMDPDPGRDAAIPPEPEAEEGEVDGAAPDGDAAGEAVAGGAAAPPAPAAVSRAPRRFPDLSAIDKLKVPELKDELDVRKLPKTGLKPALVARLKDDDERRCCPPRHRRRYQRGRRRRCWPVGNAGATRKTFTR